MIVNTTTARTFLPSLNISVANDRLNDFFLTAQEKIVEHIIGTHIESLLETPIGESETDQYAELRRYVGRAICESAYKSAIAELDLQLSEAGFVVQNNEYMSPASQQRVDRLLASLDSRLMNDCDLIVRYLMINSHPQELYYPWRTTDQFLKLSAFFIPTTELLNSNSLGKRVASYEAFTECLPKVKEAMYDIASEFVSTEQIERLVDLYRNENLNSPQQSAAIQLRFCAACCFNNDLVEASNFARKARQVMLNFIDYFPEFANSNEYNLCKTSFGNNSVANAL